MRKAWAHTRQRVGLSRRATPLPASTVRILLRDILRQVSRSFYLSLIVLPKAVRPQVSLAYLFCRAADTIADTGLLPRHQRSEALEHFRQHFQTPLPTTHTALHPFDIAMCFQQVKEGERQLFVHLSDCFDVFASLPIEDQRLIRELVLSLTRGMQMDLKYFPGDTAVTTRALPDMPTLDLYTYYVAGVVGEFWTKIHARHIAAFQKTDVQALCSLAISFGKGLQLTNVLKDLGKDLSHGRCYLPEKQLEQLGVRVEDLSKSGAAQRIRPLIQSLGWYTLDHLDCAHTYIVRLPFRSWRLRLSCMWPLLFALQTLTVVCRCERLLRPEDTPKISRYAVYRTMFWTLWCLFCPALFTMYYRHLRGNLTATLSRVGVGGVL